MTATETATSIPLVSGGDANGDHLEEMRRDPIGLMVRVREECGDVGRFRIGGRDVVMVTGPEQNEWFFRAPDALLDQAEAYPFMTPIFGEGVVFDAPPERRREMLHNQALRDSYMRGHASTIYGEVNDMVSAWDPAVGGQIDLLDWFAELTIYTSSACLIGKKFRNDLDRRFAELYHDLERGTDAYAYVDPYADIESFRRRDAARIGLVALVQGIMDERVARGDSAADDDRDLLDVLMSIPNDDGTPRFTADEVTGMFISMMFAGHHTTSGTAAWTLIELLRHPEAMAAVVDEVDRVMADGEAPDYQALRELPQLESAIKEALRLHPPLIILLRVAQERAEVGGYTIDPGQMVAASLSVSNRLPQAFPDADSFDHNRYIDPNHEDTENPWSWVPFGAGRHRCVGAPFAMMQLKTIFLTLLADWRFEAAQELDTYRDDMSKMVIQLQQPCLVTVSSRNQSGGAVAPIDTDVSQAEASETGSTGTSTRHIKVDEALCQGHGVCESEAPEVFKLNTKTHLVEVLNTRPPDEQRTKVDQAVKYCPTRAISVVED
ncbi:MAG: cytochrome P450 [Actinobacteria bacterium]|nr:cytochrome P450 [Actinomycetota bacterium]